jgi:RNA polymerase-binding transcription factor DksA
MAWDDVRKNLLARRRELSERAEHVRADLAHVLEPLVADAPDQAVQRGNDPVLSAIGEAARREMDAIDRALGRIADGRYGICTLCGEPIPAGRLRAVPYAECCAAC